eukprot:6176857-Pleurochrysis_carterae.AAC.1
MPRSIDELQAACIHMSPLVSFRANSLLEAVAAAAPASSPAQARGAPSHDNDAGYEGRPCACAAKPRARWRSSRGSRIRR